MKHKRALELAAADLSLSVGLLARRNRTANRNSEFSSGQAAVLRQLAKHSRVTTADLARSQGMKPQSMRTILASLEQKALVARKPHATDGRQVWIELTAAGEAAQKRAGEARRSWLAQAISKLDKKDQAVLLEAAGILKRLADQ